MSNFANEVPENALYPVCAHCGSDDVTMDAVARWDIKQQTWIMSDTQDFTDCQQCGGQCNIKYVP